MTKALSCFSLTSKDVSEFSGNLLMMMFFDLASFSFSSSAKSFVTPTIFLYRAQLRRNIFNFILDLFLDIITPLSFIDKCLC